MKDSRETPPVPGWETEHPETDTKTVKLKKTLSIKEMMEK